MNKQFLSLVLLVSVFGQMNAAFVAVPGAISTAQAGIAAASMAAATAATIGTVNLLQAPTSFTTPWSIRDSFRGQPLPVPAPVVVEPTRWMQAKDLASKGIQSIKTFVSKHPQGLTVTALVGLGATAGYFAAKNLGKDTDSTKATVAKRTTGTVVGAGLVGTGSYFGYDKLAQAAGFLSGKSVDLGKAVYNKALTPAATFLKPYTVDAVRNHPYIAGGLGLAALAGLSYAGYNYFSKSKNNDGEVVIVEKPVISTIETIPANDMRRRGEHRRIARG